MTKVSAELMLVEILHCVISRCNQSWENPWEKTGCLGKVELAITGRGFFQY